MRKLLCVVLAAPLLTAFQGKKLDVAGHWVLDLKKSVNLPGSFANVDSYTFDVTQTHDTLTVNAGLKGGGQTVDFPPFVYVLDGKETYRRDSLRGSERWTTAQWSKSGENILMDIRVSLKPTGRPPVGVNQHDVWKLIDPNTLEISMEQKFQGTDSVRNEKRLYRRAK